ncbi:MAG: hypothetical protein COZ70_15245 [Deltaproteobacteria bacterium CG_4_8_14_3_um_filter_51_11]|nr:hypothetical protein [bacterium]NCP08909.1 hypothetical protein [bacterium]OIP40224.1 MAG: hypothetical protein AUK25_08230 [Desulfobacteraceae bacterium CG2_30_51_40]PIX18236.1 MAG: hypothetical protein COZ70_15245 [Deltaproteobacteria bacterium CG_4_8_14_3_um_filter_51_11]PIY26973.1 MAG: hypothetical protein COZ11_01270 [Deltaproteobacteria bacterium CG_4_10_14_3_um_filter_51_14]
MDEQEFQKKYVDLRMLKSIQEFLKTDTDARAAVYPIKVPEDLLYQLLRSQGAEDTDNVIHHIFKLGLNVWSEQLFSSTFGNEQSLKEFIKILKARRGK